MTNSSPVRCFWGIPSTIWAMGLVTLCINISSVIIFTASPRYLTGVLGLSAFLLGVFEGLIEASSWFMRVFSGLLSDYTHRRKPLLTIAYALAAISRPILAFTTSVPLIYGARTLDRISNGMQATPREALVGDWAPKDKKGASYGLRQTLSLIGSFVGAFALMFFLSAPPVDYQKLFMLAAIPPVIGFVILTFWVRESPFAEKPIPKGETFLQSLKHVRYLSKGYWRVLLVAGIFNLSNYSGVFMILQAGNQGLPENWIPLVMVCQNLFAMLTAYPVGRLSDNMDRRYLLGIGFAIAAVANGCFAVQNGWALSLVGASLWGVQIGMTQSLLLTKIADTTSPAVRGAGFGLYYLLIGCILFITNSYIGWLFDQKQSSGAFMVEAVIAAFAILMLPLIPRSSKSKGL